MNNVDTKCFPTCLNVLIFLHVIALSVTADATTLNRIGTLPYTITQPGHYVLSRSIETQGNGIEIAADDVTLDLAGHTLNGPLATDQSSYGIYAFGHDGIEIRNGKINGFQYAVYLSGYSDKAKKSDDLGDGRNVVEHVSVSNSSFRGIRVEGKNSVIRHNIISDIGGDTSIDNAYAMGIETYGRNVQITDNRIEEVRGSGVADIGEGVGISLTYFVDGSVVRGNHISNRSQDLTPDMPAWQTRSRSSYGIWVGGDGATEVLVEDNTIKNFKQGITFKRSEAGAIRGNTVTHSFIPYYLPDNHDYKRVRDLGNNTSDEQTLVLKHGRSTPGQFETVEPETATYLSPMHRLRFHPFLAVPNLTSGDDTLAATAHATMVDYWQPHTAGHTPRPVTVDLATGTASGCCGNDQLKGMQGAQGTPYDDVLLGNEKSNLLAGAEGNDRIEGRGGNDFLFADAGNDELFGGEGDDVLDGGPGHDTLWGGPGADTFIFWGKAGSGNDTIQDFSGSNGEKDIIDLTGAFASFDDAMQATQQQEKDTVIRLNEHNTITLKKVRKDQLSPQDFIF